MEKPVIPVWIQMVRFFQVNFFREKGNTFGGITFFPIQPEFLKISIPFVNNLTPGSLRQHFREEMQDGEWEISADALRIK